MNATDTKTVVSFYEEDIARMKAAVVKTKAECTHVYADGEKAYVGNLAVGAVHCIGCGSRLG